MKTLVKWDPFDIEQSFFDRDLLHFPTLKVGFDLAADVYEKNGNVIAEMNIPGIDVHKFDISIEGDLLRVHGSREEEKETKDQDYYSKEIKRGSFERVLQLPAHVVADKAAAEYKNGVLRVTMPKKVDKEAGKVHVRVS
jgi:HSP20 family protein